MENKYESCKNERFEVLRFESGKHGKANLNL
jgi:hypothetical protein